MPAARKAFDWSQATFQHFVLRIAYVGSNYHGIVYQDEKVPTVELHLFRALQTTCLIQDRKSCNFSKCGRTDKGVHAASNYVAVTLRINKDGTYPNYVEILNKVLPVDIRIINAYQVPDDFDARHRCKSRTYKYFFTIQEGMNLSLMEEASKLLIGTYDFRNFCKVDPSQTCSYVRTIVAVTLTRPVGNLPVAEMQIQGTSFLWHQVRSIMTILFLIAEGLESKDIINTLLDVQTCLRKPNYDLADPAGLVLYDCEYDEKYKLQNQNRSEVASTFQRMMSDSLRNAAVHSCLSDCCEINRPTEQTRPKYTPLMKRATEPSLEEKMSAWKRRKEDKSLDQQIDD